MASSRLLVSGATGFVGTWLLRHWRRTYFETEIWATSNEPWTDACEVDVFRQVDLLDGEAVTALIEDCRPTEVVHLAGLIGAAPLAAHLSVNVVGSDNLFRALLALDADRPRRIVQTSSAAVYGPVEADGLPVKEIQLPRPMSPYGVAKLAQDHLALSMASTGALPVVVGRLFNLFGPGQPAPLVPMTFIRQLDEIRAGKTDRLRVGNTASRRDFVDVRDVAVAIERLLHSGEPGNVYNIGSGRDVSIAEIIEALLDISGLSVPVETTESRFRSGDVARMCADIGKITAATGWQPQITMTESLRAMWFDHGEKK